MSNQRAEHVSVELRSEECALMVARFEIPPELLKELSSYADDLVVIRITPDIAEDLREQAEELLPIIGFNEAYEATAEGEILESLIDKFFLG